MNKIVHRCLATYTSTVFKSSETCELERAGLVFENLKYDFCKRMKIYIYIVGARKYLT